MSGSLQLRPHSQPGFCGSRRSSPYFSSHLMQPKIDEEETHLPLHDGNSQNEAFECDLVDTPAFESSRVDRHNWRRRLKHASTYEPSTPLPHAPLPHALALHRTQRPPTLMETAVVERSPRTPAPLTLVRIYPPSSPDSESLSEPRPPKKTAYSSHLTECSSLQRSLTSKDERSRQYVGIGGLLQTGSSIEFARKMEIEELNEELSTVIECSTVSGDASADSEMRHLSERNRFVSDVSDFLVPLKPNGTVVHAHATRSPMTRDRSYSVGASQSLQDGFSVTLASLLHRGFSSSVWLCISSSLRPFCHSPFCSVPFCSSQFCSSDSPQGPDAKMVDLSPKSLNGMEGDSEIHTPVNAEQIFVVMKVIHKVKCSSEELDRLSHEVNFLSTLSHPHILGLLSFADSPTERWIFFEHAPLGDLYHSTAFKTLGESETRWLIFQIVLALHCIHSQHIIHCDIKPHNILLFENPSLYSRHSSAAKPATNGRQWMDIHLRLGDFGLAQLPEKWQEPVEFEGLRGTHGYFAPELLLKQSYNHKIDMWALGIIAFTLVGGYEPFFPVSDCTKEDVEFDPRYWSEISMDCKDFIRNLLQRNPTKRFSSLQALEHDWIRSAFVFPVAGNH